LLRFGLFEADLVNSELRKQGLKISLQEQPFRVLAVLLEKPGQVITREELRERLWGTDTFVDFDQGLNKAINRVRDALGDSAENPRFIETVPKRGYRFIAPVFRADAVAVEPAPEDNAVPVEAYLRSRPTAPPSVVFQTRIIAPNLASFQYDVARDGRFLINSFPSSQPAPLTVITGWQRSR
jgi:DNA-binding winged helix-turn-helix (wHTH) protein